MIKIKMSKPLRSQGLGRAALTLVLTVLTAAAAWADNVNYLDENGEGKTCTTATKIISSTDEVQLGADGTETWYYVDGTVNISNVVKVDGDVHIILCDGSKMTMTGTNDSAINGDNASIAIYGQSNGTVTLTTSGITAKSILAPGVTLIAEINDEKKGITVNGDVTVGSIIAETLTATEHNLTLTGTGSEIGTTYLYTGTLTVNDNAGGSVGKLTAGTVIVNNGGDLTATSVTNLSSLTVKGGVLSLSEALDLSGSSITLEDGGVIRTNAGVLTVGNVSGVGTIQGKDDIVLKCGINNPNLDIVAETKDIDATADGVTSINVKSLTAIDGGINATGKDITAGTISAKGKVTAQNIKAGSGENGSSRNVTINGGKITVESISAPNGDIILGWKAREDSIYANSYVGTVKIAEGQCFTYEGNTGDLLNGTLTADQISSITGKIIIPVDVIFSNGGQYMLLYEDEACFKIVTSGVKTYVVSGYDLSGTPTVGITEVTGGGVPKEFPFIIGVESGTLPNIIILDLASDDEATTIQSNTSTAGALKNLFVCDGTTTVADLLAVALETPADLNDYVLFTFVNGSFKPVIATATSVPAKGTCLLAIPKVDLLKQAIVGSGTSSARTLSIDLGDDTTGIETPPMTPPLEGAGSWYDLHGRRLSGMPTQKGVYIHNGHAVLK